MSTALGGSLFAANLHAAGPAATPGAPPGDAEIHDLANFDPELLRQRGFDPKLADYLRQAARFTPGTHQVSLVINGVKRGKVFADFDSRGELCVDTAFLDSAGVVPRARGTEPCIDLAVAYPLSDLTLVPESGEVRLVVSMDALRPEARITPSFAGGGTAALLNYDITGGYSAFGDASSDHLIAHAELGLNVRDWIVRSAQTYTRSNGATTFDRRHVYAERGLPRLRSILQAGDIALPGSALPGALVTGLQLLPDSSLAKGAVGAVEGVASTQARVDVRQNGTLVYSTVVAPGPFALKNLPLLDRISDLHVTVTEADQSERRFIVPASAVSESPTLAPTGYSLSAGRVRDQGETQQENPWVIAASGTWPIKKIGTATATGMVAEHYTAIGASGMAVLEEWGTSLTGMAAVSNASAESAMGTQASLSVQQRIGDRLSIGASLQRRTPGYRDLADTLDVAPGGMQSRSSAGFGATWSHPLVGALGASYTRTSDFQHIDYERATLSWSRRIGSATVTANADWSLSGNARDNNAFLSVSIPLGSPGRRVAASIQRRHDGDRYLVDVSDQPSDIVSYRVGAEQDTRRGDRSIRADVSLLPHYTQMDVGYSTGSNEHSTNYAIRGGVAFHRNGITLSPYPIRDTFALMSVGDTAGVKVFTPSGPVWTDFRGMAVAASLSPHAVSALELVPKSLPANAIVANGRKDLEVGRGAVRHVVFDVVRARRILLKATLPDGTPLPSGAAVLDSRKALVTLVAAEGEIFLTQDPTGESFRVHLPDGGECSLEFALPTTIPKDQHYETLPAVCKPSKEERHEFAIGHADAS